MFLPDTIEVLRLGRNSLTKVLGLDHLTGKKLRHLDVERNPFEIDLQPLNRSSPLSTDNPLRSLNVNAYHISWYLLGNRGIRIDPIGGVDLQYSADRIFHNRVHEAAERWIKSSVLNHMTLGRKINRAIYNNGA